MHPSAIKIFAPSSKCSKAFTPLTSSSRSPLYLANRIENEVSLISSGTIFETLPNACESVMTNAGFLPISSKVFSNSVSLTTIDAAPASRRSRIVCCCGRISLPFGAALSIGTTKITKSFGQTKSPTIFSVSSSVGTSFPISSFNSQIPFLSFALTKHVLSSFHSLASARSILL